MTILTYATLKFTDLISKPNPVINSYYKDDEMTGIAVNLNERNYKFAFTVESFLHPK